MCGRKTPRDNFRPQIETNVMPNLEKAVGLKGEQKDLLINLLKVWLGMAQVYMRNADYPAIEDIFNGCVEALQSISHPSLIWLRNTTLALALRQRAYLHKRQGHFDKAIADFQSAAQANRYLDYNFEEATIRNDLGDTQVLTGDLGNAYLNQKDAFDLRQKMKSGARLAFSTTAPSRGISLRAVHMLRLWKMPHEV